MESCMHEEHPARESTKSCERMSAPSHVGSLLLAPEEFFDAVAGPNGSFMLDTSQQEPAPTGLRAGGGGQGGLRAGR